MVDIHFRSNALKAVTCNFPVTMNQSHAPFVKFYVLDLQ